MGWSADAARKLSLALDRLLDPLDLSGRDGMRGPHQLDQGRTRPGGRAAHDRPADRLANTVYRLRWSQATRYRILRIAFTSFAIVVVSFVCIVALMLATLH